VNRMAGLLIAGLLISFAAAAQQPWSLDRCLAVAKERNVRLRIADNQARASELSRSELSTTRLPQVKLNAVSLYAPRRGQFGYDPAITDGGQLAGQMVIQQSLYDGGLRSIRSDQLNVEIGQRATERRLTERDVIAAVRLSYIEALRAQREQALQQAGVEQLSDYLDLVKRLTTAGSASATDVLKTQVQLATARAALQKATESAQLAEYTLAEAMGIPTDTLAGITGSLENLISVDADTSRLFQDNAVSANLELASSEMEFQKSLFDVESTQHESHPTFSLVGDAGVMTSGDNLRLPASQREPMFGFSIGLTAELPLLNWNATGLRVQQKQLASENLRLQSDMLRRSLNAEGRRLRLELRNAEERLHIARQTIKGSEDNFLLTKSKFAGGGSLSLEVLSAQHLMTDTRLAELQALADIQSIHARIEQFLTH
jgi:outer membrane protein